MFYYKIKAKVMFNSCFFFVAWRVIVIFSMKIKRTDILIVKKNCILEIFMNIEIIYLIYKLFFYKDFHILLIGLRFSFFVFVEWFLRPKNLIKKSNTDVVFKFSNLILSIDDCQLIVCVSMLIENVLDLGVFV